MNVIYERRSIRRYIEKEIDTKIIKEILKSGMNAPSAHNKKPYEFIVVDDKNLLNEMAQIKPEASFLRYADKAIVLLSNMLTDYWQQDLGATTQNMLLTAKEYEIGSCWIGMAPNEELENKARELLNIPNNLRVFNIISFGYTDTIKDSNNFYDEERIYYNKYEK